MIKIFCNYCDKELDYKTQNGANLSYVKLTAALDGHIQSKQFDEHLCDTCLEKAQKAIKKKV